MVAEARCPGLTSRGHTVVAPARSADGLVVDPWVAHTHLYRAMVVDQAEARTHLPVVKAASYHLANPAEDQTARYTPAAHRSS